MKGVLILTLSLVCMTVSYGEAHIHGQIKGSIERSRRILVPMYLNKCGIDFIQCKINSICCLWTAPCIGLQWPKLKINKIFYKSSLFGKKGFLSTKSLRSKGEQYGETRKGKTIKLESRVWSWNDSMISHNDASCLKTNSFPTQLFKYSNKWNRQFESFD